MAPFLQLFQWTSMHSTRMVVVGTARWKIDQHWQRVAPSQGMIFQRIQTLHVGFSRPLLHYKSCHECSSIWIILMMCTPVAGSDKNPGLRQSSVWHHYFFSSSAMHDGILFLVSDYRIDNTLSIVGNFESAIQGIIIPTTHSGSVYSPLNCV